MSPTSGKKLRYVFLARDTFPPFRVDVDTLFGIEMVNRGHQIDWILQSEEHCDRGYKTTWHGCDVWVGRNRSGNSAFKKLRREIDKVIHDLKLIKLARNNNYDFIQVRDKYISALLALIIAKRRKLRFFYWLSYPTADSSLYKAKSGLARYPLYYFLRGKLFSYILYQLVMKRADHVFVQSEQMKKDMISHGIPERQLTAVPMGVPSSMLEKSEGLLNKPANSHEKKIAYLGTLARVRRIDFLINVLAHIKQAIPEAKLYLVGAGADAKDEEFLKREAEKLGVSDSVIITGFLPMEKAWEEVADCDVCVSPFYPTPILNSTSPTKLIEYMALGKAVVANDHPEQRLVISESGAGICVPYDQSAFADAIISLLKAPDTCKIMGAKGRNYVLKNRSYPVIADRVDKIYREFFAETP